MYPILAAYPILYLILPVHPILLGAYPILAAYPILPRFQHILSATISYSIHPSPILNPILSIPEILKLW